MRSYDHKKIEKKWQKEWEKKGLHKTRDSLKGRENFHLLVEFPYPSGNLHVGHWYAFAVPDILARLRRMQGKNVLYPIGFDAFGLPAENAAIKNKLNPRTWTLSNIEYMKKQIRSMGTSFDWSREVVTCDPAYYQWTQWLFLQFFKAGLVYRKETAVNWCPKDKTVLANEQVVDGKCERCDAEVVQKQMLQWNIKITDYADRLIDDLEPLDWPREIKESQKNWIGRSEGAEIDFPLEFEKIGGPKPNYLILHGYKSSANGAFVPWLKSELEGRGYAVQVPELPHPDEPKESEQVQHVLKNCHIDEHTIIVGHSLGGGIALRVVGALNKPVAGLVLVGSVVDATFPGAEKRPFWKDFSWKIDYERIKRLATFSAVLSDLQEGNPRVSYLKYLAGKLGARLVEGNAKQEHFKGKEEPMVLQSLLPHLTVFTTRADTLFGATFLTIAPEHPWITLATDEKHEVLENKADVQKYIGQSKKKTELERMSEQKDKTGIQLRGVEAVNPATGKKIPLYVADYVLGHYGTGAVMGVPAHDERDFEFATKYKIPIVEVVQPMSVRTGGMDALRPSEPLVERDAVVAVVKHWSEDKYICLKWKDQPMQGFVTGGLESGEDPVACGVREIREETGYLNPKFSHPLGGKVHAQFFSVSKQENRFGHYIPLYFELQDGSREEIAEKEKALHEVSWLRAGEVRNFLNRPEMQVAWDRLHHAGAYTGEGILANSGEFDGMTTDEARKAITEAFGTTKKTYKLRDWIVSRQRYWGVPIPVIHCAKCGTVAVADKDLPVELPDVKDYLPEGSGKSPLAKAKKWVSVKCPRCGGKAERETDTLDTFVDSSWYFLRYTDPKNKKKFADPKKMAHWMPVDLYSGGAEHTTMHLLYSRFWHKALFDLRLVADSEPYKARVNHGLVLGPDGQKMSKSKGNVLDPDEVVERLGADTVRMYLAFMGPYTGGASYPWNPNGVVGLRRFIERVWRVSQVSGASFQVSGNSKLESVLHKTIKKVGEDIAAMKFNTAISTLMIFLNAVEKENRIGKGQWQIFLKLLAPFAPHIAEELWHELGNTSSIHTKMWPEYDPALLKDETVRIAVQINGKTRGEAEVAGGADKAAQEEAAREAVAARLEGKKIVRTIVIPDRLVNFVVND